MIPVNGPATTSSTPLLRPEDKDNDFESIEMDHSSDAAPVHKLTSEISYTLNRNTQKDLYYSSVKALMLYKELVGQRHPLDTLILNNPAICNSHSIEFIDLDLRHNLKLKIDLHVRLFIMSEGFCKLGLCLAKLGKYVDAVRHYLRAQEMFGQILADKPLVTVLSMLIYNNIGYCYRHQGNCSEAVYYFEQVLKISCENKIEGFINLAATHYLISECYFNIKNYDGALRKLSEALKITDEMPENHLLDRGYCFLLMGHCYYGKRDYTEARNQYKKALQQFVNADEESTVSEALRNISICEVKIVMRRSCIGRGCNIQ